MTSLMDLDSDQFTLAFDLVADWQLDKIKSQKIWHGWDGLKFIKPFDEEKPSYNQHNPSSSNWKGLYLGDINDICGRHPDIKYLTTQLDIRKDGFYLLTWAWLRNYAGSYHLGEMSEGKDYERVGCHGAGLDCV